VTHVTKVVQDETTSTGETIVIMADETAAVAAGVGVYQGIETIDLWNEKHLDPVRLATQAQLPARRRPLRHSVPKARPRWSRQSGREWSWLRK
jgi:hypothetical protein